MAEYRRNHRKFDYFNCFRSRGQHPDRSNLLELLCREHQLFLLFGACSSWIGS